MGGNLTDGILFALYISSIINWKLPGHSVSLMVANVMALVTTAIY